MIPQKGWPSLIRFNPFIQSVVTSVPNSPTSSEKASSVEKYWKQTLTKQEDLDPFKDFPLDKKSHKTAEEGHRGPAFGQLHDCLVESTRTGETQSQCDIYDEVPRFLTTCQCTGGSLLSTTWRTTIAIIHCSVGGATLINGSYQLTLEACVFTYFFVNDFEKFSQDVWYWYLYQSLIIFSLVHSSCKPKVQNCNEQHHIVHMRFYFQSMERGTLKFPTRDRDYDGN